MTSQPSQPPDERPIVDLQNVTRRFDGLTAVDDLNLSIPAGAILGLIGPSGSGKTTAVRMATGTLQPTFGDIRVLGETPVHFSRQAREQIAYMPQLFSLYEDLTASENVNFVAGLFGFYWWRRGELVKRALQTVDLWDARHRLARDLSGGMQRRLELACALVHDPTVLFLDEPTAGIDPVLRQSIWTSLRALRDEGRTLLVTTQYVSDAEYCDVVALLAHGRLIALDEPDALRRRAFGGDVLQVHTERPVDPEMLAQVPHLTSVRQDSPRRLTVVTADAGRSSPAIVEALGQQGIAVASVEEYQPTYDDAFAALVEADDRALDALAAERGERGEPEDVDDR
jgi:ABC-2 type transport system ATP-binding protein